MCKDAKGVLVRESAAGTLDGTGLDTHARVLAKRLISEAISHFIFEKAVDGGIYKLGEGKQKVDVGDACSTRVSGICGSCIRRN
jgi:hypothetical protein